MSQPRMVDHADRLEIRSPLGTGTRILLAVIAIFPWLAPYELLFRVGWDHYFNLFFLLAAAISLGAIAVSGMFCFVAIAGSSSQIVLDRRAATVSHSSRAPVVRQTVRVYPLADIRSVEVRVRQWSEGSPTYHLGIAMNDGEIFESGAAWSRAPIEAIRDRVSRFLGAADA
jgi:hypothetical protein